MDYAARITRFDFRPMVEIVPSELQLWVNIPDFNGEFQLETESGTIKELSDKFGFIIIDDKRWDFRGLEGKRCVVRKTRDVPILSFRFLKYQNDNPLRP
jgi:hypothetical protein